MGEKDPVDIGTSLSKARAHLSQMASSQAHSNAEPDDIRDCQLLEYLRRKLGRIHEKEPKKLDYQFEALRENANDEPRGKWIYGATNRGKSWSIFSILKKTGGGKVIKGEEFEDMLRARFERRAIIDPDTNRPFDYRYAHSVSIDDIDKINMAGDGMQNEIWRFFHNCELNEIDLLITSNFSIREFSGLCAENRAGSLESRIRRLCREIRI